MKKTPIVILFMLLAMTFTTAVGNCQSPNDPPVKPVNKPSSQPVNEPVVKPTNNPEVQPAGSAKALTGPNETVIAKGLKSWDLWLTVLISVFFGAIGGVVYELVILQGNIELPHRSTDVEVTDQTLFAIPKYMYDLGIFARIFIGGLAAIAALWILAPATAFSALATAVVAGSAGTSIFRSVQDRLLSALAQKETADTKAKAKVQSDKLEEARKEFAVLKNKIATASSSVLESAKQKSSPGAGIEQEDLDRLGDLLNEAKGVGDTIK